jgi:hypothetical protein
MILNLLKANLYPMKTTLALALLVGGSFMLTAATKVSATVLVEDTFTGGTGADTTTYPRWSTSGTPATIGAGTDTLSVTTGGSGNADRLFSRSFSEVTVGAGESLKLTLDFTGNGNSLYRFGLFDLGDGVTVTDGSLASTTTTKDGYYSFYGASNASGAVLRRETLASGTSVVMGGSTTALDSDPNNVPTTAFSGSLVSMVFTITNTGSQISILSELYSGAGGSGSIIYSMSGTQTLAQGLNKFDTIFFINGGTSMIMDNVKLEYLTSTIPEPGTYAVGMGGIAAMVALMIRRKRRA